MSTTAQKARISVEVPADLREALEVRAKAEGRDISKQVRFILQQHIQREAAATEAAHAHPHANPKAA